MYALLSVWHFSCGMANEIWEQEVAKTLEEEEADFEANRGEYSPDAMLAAMEAWQGMALRAPFVSRNCVHIASFVLFRMLLAGASLTTHDPQSMPLVTLRCSTRM